MSNFEEPKKVSDFAKWNEITDYYKVKKAGVDGAIVKVINSKNSPDGRLDIHVNGLRKAGVPVIGGYNYLYANTISKAKHTAPIFMKMCADRGIKQAWADIEDVCMKNLGSGIADIIKIYKEQAEKYNLYFGVYTGQYFYNTYIKPYVKGIENLPFWIARYPNTKEYTVSKSAPATPGLPNGIDIDGWQYTSKCVIPGVKGYTDLSLWWESAPFVSFSPEVLINVNPFTEPSGNVELGTLGNDANWVLWYLWRFGLLVDSDGRPDQTKIDSVIGKEDVELIKEAQRRLGLKPDGIVGKVTRRTWKNITTNLSS